MRTLSLTDRQIWAALMAVEGIGQRTFYRIQHFLTKYDKSWSEWWFAPEAWWWNECRFFPHQQQALLAFQQRYTPESYYGWLQEQQIDVLVYHDEMYPDLLKEVGDKPILLYCKNPSPQWNVQPIGVVGTRKISGYGRQATEWLTRQLVAEGATIVSGFMYGVDEVAHRTTIGNGGYTVGVLGYGFDHLYPKECQLLFEAVLARGGSFVTEYAPQVPASKGTFPQRNRIIAGMSEATVVVEAGLKSGSHITVQRALDYDRTVCAVPGPITNPFSQGTKWQVNQGATLVTSGREVLEAISERKQREVAIEKAPELVLSPIAKPEPTFDQPIQQQLFSRLRDAPASADELASYCQQPADSIQKNLSELELDGYVRRAGPIWIIR